MRVRHQGCVDVDPRASQGSADKAAVREHEHSTPIQKHGLAAHLLAPVAMTDLGQRWLQMLRHGYASSRIVRSSSRITRPTCLRCDSFCAAATRFRGHA